MKFKLIPWLKGFALGLAGLPLPFSLPLWYSYGGTVLARLPEWDKKTRPYALIWEMSAGMYALMCSDAVTVIRDGKWYCPVDTTFYFGVIKTGDRKWKMSEDLLEEPAGDKGVAADKILWSNYDLTDENGAVVIGASVPTVVQDVSRKPIAYLYNGVKLPALPEWDRTVYPYAALYYKDTNALVANSFTARLYIVENPITYAALMSGYITTHGAYFNGKGMTYDWISDERLAEYHGSVSNANANEWYGMTEYEWESYRLTEALTWCNHDIAFSNKDGVKLEASEPVPVYE